MLTCCIGVLFPPLILLPLPPSFGVNGGLCLTWLKLALFCVPNPLFGCITEKLDPPVPHICCPLFPILLPLLLWLPVPARPTPSSADESNNVPLSLVEEAVAEVLWLEFADWLVLWLLSAVKPEINL
jgi:hypothetical protein